MTEVEIEEGLALGSLGEADTAFVGGHDFAGNREAEANAIDSALAGRAVEAVEDAGAGILRDPGAFINDGEANKVAADGGDLDFDGGLFGAVFEGVGNEVVEHLVDANLVGQDHGDFGGNATFDGDFLFEGHGFERFAPLL